MQMIRVEWPTTPSAAETWERLRSAAPTESLFLTPEWLQSWCRHLGSGHPLLFAVVDGDEVAALAPIGVWIGVWMTRRIDSSWFYRLAYAGMFLTGAKLLYDGLK